VSAADRLPPLDPATYTPQQAAEANEIIAGPRKALISPFIPLIRSPELMGHAQRMGEYLRYRSALPLRLSELAILVTARFWTQQVEWAIHAPIAQREGISAEVVDAIANRTTPPFAKDDEALVYAFCNEIHSDQHVSDATWARAIAEFDERGTMDLVGLCGYYAMLSMVMNAAHTPAPQTGTTALPP
jgi:4-carboxymuconolactone decarboxylase